MKVHFDDLCNVFTALGFDESEISEDANLTADLEMDSTEMVELLAAIKNQFQVDIKKFEFNTMSELLNRINDTKESV